MNIQEVRIRNFRSILDETLPCDSLTALVGRNGAGKSSFLSALELFYNPSAKVTGADFYAEDASPDQDIEIAVTFAGLSPEAEEFFSPYIGDGLLTVTRVSPKGRPKRGLITGLGYRIPIFLPSEMPATTRMFGTNTTKSERQKDTRLCRASGLPMPPVRR